MRSNKSKVTIIITDSNRKDETLRQGIRSWTQFYHEPYKCDIGKARSKAIGRKWRVLDE